MINPVQSNVSFKGVEQLKTQDFKGNMPVSYDVRGDYEKAISDVTSVQQSAMKAVNSALGNNLDVTI